MLAVYLLFSVACFFTVHEHLDVNSSSSPLGRENVSNPSCLFPKYNSLITTNFLHISLSSCFLSFPLFVFPVPYIYNHNAGILRCIDVEIDGVAPLLLVSLHEKKAMHSLPWKAQPKNLIDKGSLFLLFPINHPYLSPSPYPTYPPYGFVICPNSPFSPYPPTFPYLFKNPLIFQFVLSRTIPIPLKQTARNPIPIYTGMPFKYPPAYVLKKSVGILLARPCILPPCIHSQKRKKRPETLDFKGFRHPCQESMRQDLNLRPLRPENN